MHIDDSVSWPGHVVVLLKAEKMTIYISSCNDSHWCYSLSLVIYHVTLLTVQLYHVTIDYCHYTVVIRAWLSRLRIGLCNALTLFWQTAIFRLLLFIFCLWLSLFRAIFILPTPQIPSRFYYRKQTKTLYTNTCMSICFVQNFFIPAQH